MKFKTRLEQVMYEQERKKSWLAKQVGVDNATVTRWIKGDPPKDEHKKEISRLLNVPVGFLFFEETVDLEVTKKEAHSA